MRNTSGTSVSVSLDGKTVPPGNGEVLLLSKGPHDLLATAQTAGENAPAFAVLWIKCASCSESLSFAASPLEFPYNEEQQGPTVVATNSQTGEVLPESAYTVEGTAQATAPGSYTFTVKSATDCPQGSQDFSWVIKEGSGSVSGVASPTSGYKVWFSNSNPAQKKVDVNP
jgi:hypothetical protein